MAAQARCRRRVPESSMDAVATDRRANGKERLLRAVMSALASQRGGAPLTAGLAGETGPASLTQQRLWMLEQLAPGTPVNNLCVAYRLRGALSVERLRDAIAATVERHDVLRTTFALDGTRLRQRVHASCRIGLDIVRLEDLPDDDAQTSEQLDPRSPDNTQAIFLRIDAWARTQGRRTFATGALPLIRPALLKIDAHDHLLVLTVHHLAFDGWSFDLLMRELCARYEGIALPPQAPDAPRYVDYAAWQRGRLETDAAIAARTFWSTLLLHAPPPVRLPADARGGSGMVRRGARHAFPIADGLAKAVERFADQYGCTDFMVYLAAYMALLHRYTANEDLVVGFPIANRCLGETRAMIGPFVQMFPIRISITAEDRFNDLLPRLCGIVLEAYAHQSYPVSALLEGVGPGDAPGGTPQCNFAYQNVPHSDWHLGELQVEAWDVGNGAVANDLTLLVWQGERGLQAHLEYDCERFDARTIAVFSVHFRALLHSAIDRPDIRISCLALSEPGSTEIARLRAWGNGAAPAAPIASVHEAFRTRALATPDAVALVAGDRQLSYAELDRSADRVARRLWVLRLCGAEADAPAERLIAFKLAPSIERIVLLLAILKAGAAYLPLNSDMPYRYADALLADARAICIVVDDAHAWRGPVRALSLAALFDQHEDEDATAPLPLVDATALACRMYTSGSSGRAKAVDVAHRGIVNLAHAPAYLDPVGSDVFLQLAPISFDASSFEIWGALLNGAGLVVLLSDKPSLRDIAEAIHRHDIGVLWLSSGLFEAMLDAHPDALRSLRQLLVGGDVVSAAHVARYLSLSGGGRLFNGYGPTENTTFTTVHAIERASFDSSAAIPIGRPIPGAKVRVLDAAGRPVPAGIVGEACVGGMGLMSRDRGDDADRPLIDDPFGEPGDRLYRTGDAVRWRSDGLLDFVGRLDAQIKLRGFRIEPSHVEAALKRSALVRACAVAGCDVDAGQPTLIAAVVPADAVADRSEMIVALRAFLRSILPGYLVPARFAVVDALPLTTNGKIDRRALSRLVSETHQNKSPLRAPRDHDETILHAAFARALGHDRFGVYDDFFSLGGDSLGALRLLAQIERELGARLSLADVFALRTVASLAARIRHDAPAVASVALPPGLVEIKRGSGATPLFFVPGGKGGHVEMTLYAELMRHVAGEMPSYGFITRPERGGRVALSERARAYIARMRMVQRTGPYRLAGECIGGLVAFEMAQQLKQAHEDVTLLLIDTWRPSTRGTLHYYGLERPAAELRASIGEFRAYADGRMREAARAGLVRLLRCLPEFAFEFLRLIAATLSRTFAPERPRADADPDADFDYVRQAMAYRPEPYAGDAVFLASTGNRDQGIVEPWRYLVNAELRVIVVPGDHASYLRERVVTTAQAVHAVFDAAPHVAPHTSSRLDDACRLNGRG
jgi:amino acid adenylation domain-containing protein